MSDELAIAAVTETLKQMLSSVNVAGVGGFNVKTLPPDKARPSDQDNTSWLNLVLLQPTPNAAWRNMDLPERVRPGETGLPPLALNLLYLLTAYGQGDNDPLAQRLLGGAMRLLHDHAVLSASEIRTALPQSTLADQAERVRITLHPLTLDELSKIWSLYQTPYRLTVCYQVSVVLLESKRPVKAALPVLGQTVQVQADLLPPYPALTAVELPPWQAGAQPNDPVVLRGHRLSGDTVRVRLTHTRSGESVLIKPTVASATAVTFRIPKGPPYDPAGGPSSATPKWREDWGPGPCSAAVSVTANGQSWVTNDVPLTVVPVLTSITPQLTAPVAGSVTYIVSCRPNIQPSQRVSLLLGDREVPAQPLASPAEQLTFIVSGAVPGQYFARLRVDGADSLVVDAAADPPAFRSACKVTVK